MTNEIIEILEDDELEQENEAMGEQSKIDAERAAFESHPRFKGMNFTRNKDIPQYYISTYANGALDGWMTARTSLPVGVPDGFRVMKPTGAVLRDGDRWEIYAPCGSGGIVHEDDVTDWVVRQLLDAMVAVPTVKAEQVPTPEFVWVRLLEALAGDNGCPFTASTDDYREAKPALVQLIAAGFFRDDADSLDGDVWTIAAGEQSEAAARFASCADAYAVLSDVLNRVFERPEEDPSLPAAGSAAGSADLIADAERCLFVLREIGSMDGDDITGDDVDLRFEDDEGRDTGCDVSIVDYAEKSADVIEKMIAALSAQQSARSLQAAVDQLAEIERSSAARRKRIDESLAQQSAPERVNVPVDLANRLAAPLPGDRGWQTWHTQDMIEASKELRALLASRGRGEA